MPAQHRPLSARVRSGKLPLSILIALITLVPDDVTAQDQSGTLVQWGMNIVDGPPVPNVTRVAVGDLHVLALQQNGELLGWGSNLAGELQVQSGNPGTNLIEIAAGNGRSAGLWSDNRVTGSGTSAGFTYMSWTNVTAISMRGVRTVGRRADGTVQVTGGVAPPSDLNEVTAVAAGGAHALALLDNGTVVAWGDNNHGQCDVPADLTGVTAVAAGADHSLALLANGSVLAWGAGTENSGTSPDYGQSLVPEGLQGVIAIAAGAYHSVALKSNGTVVCWGNNESNQCDVPPGLSNVFRIAAGTYATAAIMQPAPEIAVATDNRLLRDGSRASIGPVATGGSLARAFTIINQGTAPLTGIQVLLDGIDGARFTLTPPASASLAPGESTTFTVTFQPVAAGACFARARILSNDVDEGGFAIPLLGTTPMGAVTWGGRRDRLLDRIPEVMADVVGVATSTYYSAVLRADGRVLVWGGDDENGVRVGYLWDSGTAAQMTGVRQIELGEFELGENSQGVLLKHDGSVHEFNTRGGVSGPVFAAGSGVTRVAAGQDHYLAQLANGGVFAWGDNSKGQTNVPVGTSGLLDIAAGSVHSAAVTSAGTVITWGDNSQGQCDVPVGLADVVDVAAGGAHTLALRKDGTIVAWGSNVSGESTVPTGLAGVVAVEARGQMSAAILADGSVVLWGFHAGPAPAGLPRVAEFRGHGYQSIAMVAPVAELRLSHLGRELHEGFGFDFGWTPPGVPLVKTFTLRNAGGANAALTLAKSGTEAIRYTVTGLPASLAAGASADFTVTLLPSAVGPQHAVLALSGGDPFRDPFHLPLAGRTPMSVTGWGLDSGGASRPPPDLVDAIALAAGANHSLALRANGTVIAWGDNEYGKATVPADLQNVVAIAAGSAHSLALRQNGSVVQWGNTPIPPPAGLSGVTAIAAGETHSLALQPDGTVVAWGTDIDGETIPPLGLTGVTAIGAGSHFSLALSMVGLYGPMPTAWGRNTHGQLAAPFFDDGVAMAGGGEHAAALRENGKVVAWGRSQAGQTNVPSDLIDVRAIAAGGNHTFALRNDGTLVSWGSSLAAVPPGLGAVGGMSAGGTYGLALTRPSPVLMVKKGGIELSTVNPNLGFSGPPGVGSDPVTLTLRNVGGAPLTGLAASLPAGAAADFTLTQPAATSLAPGEATSLSIRYLAADENSKDVEMQIASNDPARNPYAIRLTAEPDANIARAWKYTWFGNRDSGAAFGMAFDFENDGTPNLLEFAFGTDPTVGSSGPGPLVYSGPVTGGGTLVAHGQPVMLRPSGGTGALRAAWIRRKDHAAAAIVYTPEFSANLRDWTPSSATPQVLASAPLHEVVAVDFPTMVTGGIPRFLRLRVILEGAE